MSAVSLPVRYEMDYAPRMDFYNQLKDVLKRAQGNDNLLSFSKKLGVDRASLYRFLEVLKVRPRRLPKKEREKIE